uniref:HAD family phosphatase n=1 Tax=Gongylonema pulchrum TaxID=637853 RepID=A0A183D485_9BILA
LVTMDRFKEKPTSSANVLVFEDSANGVLAAVAAGMQVVMVPDPTYMEPPEAVKDKIAFVLKSLEEFRPETMGLPPYD